MITKETIEKLKTTWTAFGGLSKEEQEFLLAHMKSVLFATDKGEFIEKGTLGSLWPNSVYRLRPDFQWIEPERLLFDTDTKEICKDDTNGFLPNVLIEITAEQKDYLENKPFAEEGFEWVLRVPVKGDRYLSCGGYYYVSFNDTEINTRFINGIRWTRVRVPKPSLREAAQRAVDAFNTSGCFQRWMEVLDTRMIELKEALKKESE